MYADPVLARINDGMALPPEQRRERFAQIWADFGEDQGDPLYVCVLAHAMADVQDDLRQELLWDERALTAIGALTDERLSAAGLPFTVAGLYPSLYLNLADCHRRIGRGYLEQARAGIGALGDDDYGRLIRNGLDQLEQKL